MCYVARYRCYTRPHTSNLIRRDPRSLFLPLLLSPSTAAFSPLSWSQPLTFRLKRNKSQHEANQRHLQGTFFAENAIMTGLKVKKNIFDSFQSPDRFESTWNVLKQYGWTLKVQNAQIKFEPVVESLLKLTFHIIFACKAQRAKIKCGQRRADLEASRTKGSTFLKSGRSIWALLKWCVCLCKRLPGWFVGALFSPICSNGMFFSLRTQNSCHLVLDHPIPSQLYIWDTSWFSTQ